MNYKEMMGFIGNSEVETILLTDEKSTLSVAVNIETKHVVFLVRKTTRSFTEECDSLERALQAFNE